MFGSSSHALSYRPLSAPSFPGIRVPALPASLSPLIRSIRSTCSHSRPPIKTWKISCFRQDEITSENLKPEMLKEILAEELLIPKFDNATVVKKTWASNFAEAVYSVFRAIATPWNVPWTGETILQVMLLWIAAFWFVGSWMILFVAHMAGSTRTLTHRGQALYILLTDATEGVAGIAILCRCLSRVRPLPPGWFKFSIKGNWHIDVALGCVVFPLVNWLSQLNLDLLPLLPSTPIVLSSVEQSILARDPVAMGFKDVSCPQIFLESFKDVSCP